MGDCWATETPLIMLNNVFMMKELDSCVARDREDLVLKINLLYEDPLFYLQLQKAGLDAYCKRTVDAVGDELFAILSRTIENMH